MLGFYCKIKLKTSMRTLILASASPRRHALLTQTGLDFKIVPSNYQEDMALKLKPAELAKKLSRGKAEEVAKRYKDAVVIGADTFVIFKNDVLGKPKTPEKARVMLRMLSGKTNSVITGYTIMDKKQIISRAVETKIFMRKYSNKEIETYIKTGEPLQRAGAYAIQEIGGNLIEGIDGDFFNVIGLPIFELLGDLKKFGIEALR